MYAASQDTLIEEGHSRRVTAFGGGGLNCPAQGRRPAPGVHEGPGVTPLTGAR